VDLTLRQMRALLWVAVALIGFGIWAFFLRGADEPADPVLGAPVDPALGLGTASTDPGDPGPSPPTPGDPERVLLPGFSEVAITVDPPGEGGLLAWCLLAAITAEQRSRGLMEVTDLQGYPGMAFLYDEPVENAFYMRNTPMPLSIAWIDGDGTLVSTADMVPCEDREGCPTYPPGGPYRTAIEVPQGRLGDLGITEGAIVTVGGACAPT
jgi:uncharacterized membrane protein (UPF0127 family)